MRTPTIGETGTWVLLHIVQEFSGDSVFHLLCDCLTPVRMVYHSYPPRLNLAKRLIPVREVDTQNNQRSSKDGSM